MLNVYKYEILDLKVQWFNYKVLGIEIKFVMYYYKVQNLEVQSFYYKAFEDRCTKFIGC